MLYEGEVTYESKRLSHSCKRYTISRLLRHILMLAYDRMCNVFGNRDVKGKEAATNSCKKKLQSEKLQGNLAVLQRLMVGSRKEVCEDICKLATVLSAVYLHHCREDAICIMTSMLLRVHLLYLPGCYRCD